jgi:60 kDa SS-A/Ro ribonucleoprotein
LVIIKSWNPQSAPTCPALYFSEVMSRKDTKENKMQSDLNRMGTRATAQTEPIPGKTMVANSAGGYSYQADNWTQLRRFLILGTWGGSYYASQRELTRENLDIARACLNEDPARYLDIVEEVHEGGMAPKMDPTLYLLALASAEGNDYARFRVHMYLPTGLRTASQLFMFAMYVKTLRGWGRGLRRAVASWYEIHPDLALQVIKYRQRYGWSHRDMARVSHPKLTGERQALLAWAVRDQVGDDLPEIVKSHIAAQAAQTSDELLAILNEQRLPWESIPTDMLRDRDVMRALIPTMPVHALLRQLGRLTDLGLTDELERALRNVNLDTVKRARLHPLGLLAAINTYSKGRGERGQLSWSPSQGVLDRLDEILDMSYHAVRPTGKNLLIGLDVSGSMSWGNIAGIGGLTPRDAGAALVSMYLRTEPNRPQVMAFSHQFEELDFGKKTRIDDVIRKTQGMRFGGTDCSLPMKYALKNGLYVDSFLVITDSETYFGDNHPSQLLQEYRRQVNPDAKLIVIGMVSNGFTIADPDDAGMLDIVGFDMGGLAVLEEFVRGTF